MKDLYWLAGLMEGEGSFGLRRSSSRKYISLPVVQLGMTDHDVVSRARDVLSPSSRVYTYAHVEKREAWSSTNFKKVFKTGVVGVRAAGWMMTLYPLMGVRRQEAIRTALAAWKARPPAPASRVFCKRGHPYNEANTIITNGGKGRWCRECQRLHGRQRRETLPESKRQEYLKWSREYRQAQRAAFIGPRRPPGRIRKSQEA